MADEMDCWRTRCLGGRPRACCSARSHACKQRITIYRPEDSSRSWNEPQPPIVLTLAHIRYHMVSHLRSSYLRKVLFEQRDWPALLLQCSAAEAEAAPLIHSAMEDIRPCSAVNSRAALYLNPCSSHSAYNAAVICGDVMSKQQAGAVSEVTLISQLSTEHSLLPTLQPSLKRMRADTESAFELQIRLI